MMYRLASLEAGEKDSGEFTRWQEDMKQVCMLPDYQWRPLVECVGPLAAERGSRERD